MCAQLKILACNISGGDIQGEILVNGSLVNPKDFRKQSAVVWQSDVLLPTATVRPPAEIQSVDCESVLAHIPLLGLLLQSPNQSDCQLKACWVAGERGADDQRAAEAAAEHALREEGGACGADLERAGATALTGAAPAERLNLLRTRKHQSLLLQALMQLCCAVSCTAHSPAASSLRHSMCSTAKMLQAPLCLLSPF